MAVRARTSKRIRVVYDIDEAGRIIAPTEEAPETVISPVDNPGAFNGMSWAAKTASGEVRNGFVPLGAQGICVLVALARL